MICIDDARARVIELLVTRASSVAQLGRDAARHRDHQIGLHEHVAARGHNPVDRRREIVLGRTRRRREARDGKVALDERRGSDDGSHEVKSPCRPGGWASAVVCVF